jgi:hypothetical protein
MLGVTIAVLLLYEIWRATRPDRNFSARLPASLVEAVGALRGRSAVIAVLNIEPTWAAWVGFCSAP